jgi:hypothetical protein
MIQKHRRESIWKNKFNKKERTRHVFIGLGKKALTSIPSRIWRLFRGRGCNTRFSFAVDENEEAMRRKS